MNISLLSSLTCDLIKKLTCVLRDKSDVLRSKIFKDFFPHLHLKHRKILCLWAHPVCGGGGVKGE